ncbi:MAG: class IV adenylate cyclase [archaeon]
MAYSDTEVELKLRVGRRAFSAAEKTLNASGKFLSESRQIDTYYNHPKRDFLSPSHPFEWLSIRRRGAHTILNYKHFYPENARKTTHCTELETGVSDPGKAARILGALGFQKLVVVDKKRRNYSFRDFTVSLDRVAGLGLFAEIESERSFGSIKRTLAEIWRAAKALGLNKFKEDFRGYPYLLLEKAGLMRK